MVWEEPLEIDELDERTMQMRAFFDALCAIGWLVVIVAAMVVLGWAVQG